MRVRRVIAPPGSPPPAGFPRWAWWTVFLATFTFAVPLTSPWWSTGLRGEIPGTAEDEGEDPTAAFSASVEPVAPVVPGSTLRVVLHTRLPDAPGLAAIEREVPYVRGVIPQIQAAVSELAVSSPEAPALLPVGTRVLDVAFTQAGLVYIDLSPELDTGRVVGPDEERLIVRGIVTTITENFKAVRRVVILIDGKAPVPYHLDLTHPLRPDDPAFAVDDEPEPPVGSEAVAVDPGEATPKASAAPIAAEPKPSPVTPVPAQSKPSPVMPAPKPAATP